MDKEAENKIEAQNNNIEIKEETNSEKPKKTTKQTEKKTTGKKSDSKPKTGTSKAGSTQSKKSVKKADDKNSEAQIKENKKTGQKKESSKPTPKNTTKKAAAKKEQPKNQLNTFAAEDEVLKTNENIIISDEIKTSEELSDLQAKPKTEKAVKKTVKKAPQKQKQILSDEITAGKDDVAAAEPVLPAEISEPLKISQEPQAQIAEGSDEPKQQSEQTITISDSFDSGVSADEIQSELYEQEVSADQAAVIAQTAISQEALLPNSTVFIPQTATRKSIADVIKQSKNLLIYGIITLFLIAVYIGYAQYFKTRFYLGTTINGISISGLSLQDANTKLNDALQNYSLTIIERSNSGEQIKAQDISLAYNSLDDLNTYLSSQSGYGWLGAIFSKNSKKTIVMSYDAEQLNQQIGNLSFLKPENIIKPGNPSFNYVNGSYVIVQEVTGNEVDQDTLYKAIADNICIMNTKLDLQQADCYTKPAYTANSQKTIDTQNLLNTYAAVQITYIIGTEQIIIDASQICSWMSVDNDLNIVFNKNKIQNFVNNLEKISSAVTYTRNFKTTAGSIVQITGGNYGRYMSFAKENDFITNTIKSGVSATRDFNEIGSTYVEISLTKQHIWFYKNGTLVVEGSIVTGNVMNHKATPKGVYYLRSKTRNTTLVGPDYEADVSYWMPFNRGIGLHDATWRSYFGGSIYKTNGSHGCVNLPYNVAKKIYNNISVGTPVVVY